MVEHASWSRKWFLSFNYIVLALMAFACLFPIIQMVAVSFSSGTAASSGRVTVFPIEFTTDAYRYVMRNEAFMRSVWVSVERVVLGSSLQMLMMVLIAYPLSKDVSIFRFRTVYVWFFMITILFSGGLIPTYLTIKMTGLMNSIWALVIPNAVPVFSVVLLLNFFRNLPKELSEAAFIDGAGHWKTLWKIYIPLSTPGLATLLLFSLVGHWNSWFDGIIYMNSPDNYPLQSYLQTIILLKQDSAALSVLDANILSNLSDRTLKSAQIGLGALPILLVYPFLQRYFMKGIVLGSVKE
ncbi:carbohydrate ABC transporter permease [Paenibacillus eucommiae]|uniref:Aldouronate transport system permease protein n=1 Tax=Paenibacillus eucommiae TaxID=1355755 RepID=A0ABS4IY20_9BACL|nr:carbohydrate ABC transporter permease [Paenibacillus eucommiae]MBP1991876.1 putative aldouronate transport system permease protein [Paenibacillus eucommiae]